MIDGLWKWLTTQVKPVAYKEFVHMFNDQSTLRIAIFLPLIQLTIFGYAINMDVENIPIVVLNQDNRTASYQLVDKLINTHYFKLKRYVHSKNDLMASIRKGDSQIGVVIPPDYSDNIALGRKATYQVLIDGSDSNMATQSLSTVIQLGDVISRQELAKEKIGSVTLEQRVEAMPFMLYNPALKTNYFTVPGLLGVVLLNVTLFLTTFSLVKEREQGTMDQLLVTPLRPSGLMVGKMIPYVLLGMFDLNLVILAMVLFFKVPISGSLLLLEFCALLFLTSVLGLGLLVSGRTQSQAESAQVAGLVVLPSILLSGFIFSIPAMPKIIQLVSYSLPMTYFIKCLRGIILRGAGFFDLLFPMTMMFVIGMAILITSIVSFRRRLS